MSQEININQLTRHKMNQSMASTSSELVFIPAPGVGHIVSTVEIAKLLVKRYHRLSVTVLIMKLTIDTGVMAYVESLHQTSIERIRFVDLPRDESLPEPKSRMLMLNDFIESEAKYVREVVAHPGLGRLAGFVIDMFCTPMIDVANEFGVPTYLYFTSSAAFLGFRHYLHCQSDDHNMDVHKLVTDADSEQLELDIPCFVNPVPVKVFPYALHDEVGASFTVSSARKFREVKGVLVNTFLEMETHAIEACLADKTIPPVYPVGPILNLDADDVRRPTYDGTMRWLDLQPPSSVVFLCFGSMGSFGEAQVREIAYALEASGQRFLWSLRRPPSNGKGVGIFPGEYEDPGEVLPDGFLERTAGIGKVIGWAPQVSVLAHRAVGGFVSHCGWNSILESVWFGVPIAAWPMFAEQQINAFEMVVELGLGVEIKLDYKKDFFAVSGGDAVVTSDEIERGIRKLMDGENEIRKKVKEMSEKSRAAVAEGGSSYDSLAHFIDIIIENKEVSK